MVFLKQLSADRSTLYPLLSPLDLSQHCVVSLLCYQPHQPRMSSNLAASFANHTKGEAVRPGAGRASGASAGETPGPACYFVSSWWRQWWSWMKRPFASTDCYHIVSVLVLWRRKPAHRMLGSRSARCPP